MKLEQSFDVQAPLDHVWEALIDLDAQLAFASSM